MSDKAKILFLLLVIVQGFHSLEEYFGQLWDVFPPATFLTGLFAEDLETGFIIINVGFFLFGILSWIFFVRTGHSIGRGIALLWVVIEIINGIGQPVWSIMQASYTPGLITAPLLLILALSLGAALRP